MSVLLLKKGPFKHFCSLPDKIDNVSTKESKGSAKERGGTGIMSLSVAGIIGERKCTLIEDNMSGYIHTSSAWIDTTITFMIEAIPKKIAFDRSIF
jgi:hypothetical protein